MEALISIVIPVYKTEQYLDGCIRSVAEQTYENLQVIVVDDGSPDQAYKKAEKWCEKDRRIQLIRQENKGLSGARNTGIQHASGKYILFLDSDDALTPNAVEGMAAAAEKDESDAVIPTCYYKVSEGKTLLKRHFEHKNLSQNPQDFVDKIIIRQGRAWKAAAVLYKMEIVKKHELFFPIGYTSEDIMFNISFMLEARKISYYCCPTLYYLVRKNSISHGYNEGMLRNFRYIDEQVGDFYERTTGTKNHVGRDSLMCRNAVLILINLMRRDNGLTEKERRRQAENFLMEERIREAFCEKVSIPYFDSFIKEKFFQTEYFLLRHKKRGLACVLARLASRRMG